MVFSNHLDINYPILDNIFVLLIISIIISSLSYFYIEQPFRGKEGLKFISRSKVFYYSGILLLILSIFCFYGILNKGLEKRFSSEIVNFEKDNNEIQPLLDEITILREQNLQLNQQLLEERINAA